jgi:hypothetical protein
MDFSKLLIDWYLQNKRDLPWRKTKNPYKIWMSEIILQQTRVQQGLPYYQKFISSYPTIQSLALANEDEVLFSALASMCIADDDLVGSQLSPGTPSSLLRNKMVSSEQPTVNNPLSLYSSFLAFQAQHASSGHDKIIISALRNFQDDEPKEREEHSSPSFFDKGILQPTEVEADNEPKVETTPPVKRVTRSKARNPAFVIPASYEPPSSDDSGPEGDLTVPDAAAAAAPAARSKRAGSKSTPSTADQRRGRKSTPTAVVAANPRFTWDVIEDHSPPAMVPRSTPK